MTSATSAAPSAAAAAVTPAPVAAASPVGASAATASPLAGHRLARDAFGRLVLTLPDGTCHEGLHPVRAFPLAEPQAHISLVGTDGRELVWVSHLDQLDAADRALLEHDLAQRECVPVIRRLVSVSTFATPSQWVVDTDRGQAPLLLKAEEDIRRLPERGRLLISSGHGLHFLVPDRFALDRQSRKWLERFL